MPNYFVFVMYFVMCLISITNLINHLYIYIVSSLIIARFLFRRLSIQRRRSIRRYKKGYLTSTMKRMASSWVHSTPRVLPQLPLSRVHSSRLAAAERWTRSLTFHTDSRGIVYSKIVSFLVCSCPTVTVFIIICIVLESGNVCFCVACANEMYSDK